MLIPFYVVNNIMIDAYFMDKLSNKEDRILLIKERRQGFSLGEVKPIPYETLISYLEEGFSAVKRGEKRNLKISEVLESIFYNQSVYLRNREKEILENIMKRFYEELYSRLFLIIRKVNTYELTWHDIKLNNGEVMFNGVVDRVYTKLYVNDPAFRSELNRLLIN
jgi:hypothetical protein